MKRLLGLFFFLASVCSAQINNPGGSGVSPNAPITQSSVGPGFNVKNYGAKGDAQAAGGCSFTSGVAQFTCSGAAFSASTDVGKNLFCNSLNAGFSFFGASLQTIASVQNATTATASTTAGATAAGVCVWGTLDDTPVSTAVTAAKAASLGVVSTGNKGIFSATPRLYFPAGGYLLCTTLLNGVVVLGSTVDGFLMEGDGSDQTFIYPGSSAACPLTNNSTLGSIVQSASGAANIHFHKFTTDGVFNFSNQSNAMSLGGNVHTDDIIIQRWGGNSAPALFVAGSNNFLDHTLTVNNVGAGFNCTGCSGEWTSGGSSNNGNSANLVVSGVVGSNSGLGFRVGRSVLIDECGTNATGCTQVINSNDVWFIGPSLFGTPNGFCVNVDANSFLHWVGGICGTFGTDNNTNGPRIAAGGTLQASDLRMIGSGTGKCLTNNGLFNDNGGNACETMFPIASGTSTGTAAVLTVTTLGANANTNCTAGDSLVVEGAGVAGYNGYFKAAVTAATATTISYTSVGSNMGALGAGGSVTCRNLQSYSGTLPVALLNNPVPNTCYVTGTFGATVTGAPMCAFKTQSATNVTNIKAASTTVTACTVAPVVTISDGTATVTLTLTTAKSLWDSSVDTSTGVGTTIFKPNGTIQVTNTVGTCTTAPTNFSVSYNISPILSN